MKTQRQDCKHKRATLTVAANWFIVFFGGAAAAVLCPPPMRLSRSMDRPLSLHVEGEGCSRVGGEASLAPGLSGGECMQAQEQYM